MAEICSPIDTLDDLYNFMKNPPEWGKLSVQISRRSRVIKNQDLYNNGQSCHMSDEVKTPIRYSYGTVPKTLVCHDMMNGYHDDRFVNGTDNSSAYTFYQWGMIDIFVYFSHHFITIPPLGWINTAHKHGVQILGTIITEWDQGIKICDEFLKSDNDMLKFSRELTAVAKYFKMDGWLLNIENKISEVSRLKQFVKQLSDDMHDEIPNSLVIWYDSVTDTGSLNWQNALNDKNKGYFDVCDGIFTNYCWSKYNLEESVKVAGRRKVDVYVGVDVWGRNFWGGGCFNTAAAVKEIHKVGLSIAIFGQGWTHEAINKIDVLNHQTELRKLPNLENCLDKHPDENYFEQSPYLSECANRDYFLFRENSFWCTLRPYLNTRGPIMMPFHTFFCMGSGDKRRYAGKVIQDEPWFNLREQQYQLTNTSCSSTYILVPEEFKIPKRVSSTTATSPNENVITANSTCINQCSEITESEITEATASIDNASPSKSRAPPLKFNLKPNEIGCVSYYTSDSYNGGNCIKISPVIGNPKTRLFECEFHCDHSFIIYSITKNLDNVPDQELLIILSLKSNKKQETKQVTLCEQKLYVYDTNVQPICNVNNEHYKKLKKNLKLIYPGFYVEDENDQGWKIKYYYINYPNSIIQSIGCQLFNDSSPMLLGGIGVVNDILPF